MSFFGMTNKQLISELRKRLSEGYITNEEDLHSLYESMMDIDAHEDIIPTAIDIVERALKWSYKDGSIEDKQKESTSLDDEILASKALARSPLGKKLFNEYQELVSIKLNISRGDNFELSCDLIWVEDWSYSIENIQVKYSDKDEKAKAFGNLIITLLDGGWSLSDYICRSEEYSAKNKLLKDFGDKLGHLNADLDDIIDEYWGADDA